METLRLLVQNLIIIIILAVILEMLLPNGEMRRYAEMVMGLMIIVAVVQALNGLSGGSLFREIEEYAWRSAPDGAKKVDILEQGRRLDAENRKQAVEQYKKGVERQISALLGAGGKARLVEAEVKIQDDPLKNDFGMIREIRLVLGREAGVKSVEPVSVNMNGDRPPEGGGPLPEDSGAASEAAGIVANFYNLPRERIKVTFRD
ncbi:MAG: stage III sporulation protein AF [Peptococcaceae bacterium]|nr:stage III sporulation protein AF [Peptococcaceae bacterium]